MAELLVVTGPPGAGTSTVAALVVQAFERVAARTGHCFADLATAEHVHAECCAAAVHERQVLRTTDEAADEVARRVLDRWSLAELQVG